MNNGKTVKSGLNTAFTCDKLSRHVARMQNLGGGGSTVFGGAVVDVNQKC